jgi:glycosyltransferase involved in cell wall biosynthesis
VKKIFVITPAYNEEHSVGHIVREVLKNPGITQCVVIDDCSTDQTAEAARKNGARVIQNGKNIGSGASIGIGLKYAAKEKADTVVLMDADGQHDPKYIPKLIKSMDLNTDYVVASRYMLPGEYVTAFPRRLGTKLISGLFRLFYGQVISDPTSGFRAMNKKTFNHLLDHFPTVFSEPETALELIEKGYVFKEIPCQMKPRLYGNSSITSDKAMYFMIYIVIKMVYRKTRNVLTRRQQ